jgi:hypothetical protein
MAAPVLEIMDGVCIESTSFVNIFIVYSAASFTDKVFYH